MVEEWKINPSCSDPEYIVTIRKKFYLDNPLLIFTKLTSTTEESHFLQFNLFRIFIYLLLLFLTKVQLTIISGEYSNKYNSYLEEYDTNGTSLVGYKEQDKAGFKEELQDFDNDAPVHNVPPKKASATHASRMSNKCSKKPTPAMEVGTLSLGLSQTMFTEDPNYFITYVYVLSWRQEISKKVSEEIVHYHIQSPNLPTSYFRTAKVMPGGMKFALLVAAPMWFFEEGFLMIIMDDEWDEANGCVISADKFVTHPILTCHSELSFCGWKGADFGSSLQVYQERCCSGEGKLENSGQG